MVICPDCRNEVPEAKFCKNCGAYIGDVKQKVDSSIESNDDSIPVTIKSDVEEVVPIKSETVPVNSDEAVPVEYEEVTNTDKSTRSVKYCFNCGHELDGDFKYCPECGQDLSGKVAGSDSMPVKSSGEKSIILAIILSVFLPGLGQIYLGLDHKGAIFLIAYVISAILILILIGFLLCFVIWIWALIDTIMSTNALNRGEEVKDKLL